MSAVISRRRRSGTSRRSQFLQRLRGAFLDNIGLKLLSLLAAFALWLFVNAGARDSESAFQVPLQLQNLPPHLMIVSPQVSMIDIRVSGPRALLSRINPADLSIRLDLGGVRPGPAVFRVLTDQLNLPRGVRIVRLTPSEITLEMARIGRHSVPVHLQLVGKPPRGLVVAATKVSPDSIDVTGPMTTVDELKSVDTAPIDLAEVELGESDRDVALEAPPELVSYSSFLVHAELRVQEAEHTRIWKAAPVVVRNAPGPLELSQETVTIGVRGPRSVVESLELEHGAVYIDAAGLEPGKHVVPVMVDLPAEAELVRQEPAGITVEVLHERRKGHGR